MKLNDDGDFTALNWIKPALDATLAQARDALEAYVEKPADLVPMRDCVAHLHQVQGTLRMVELYGAAMVVENMERLAEGLLDDTVRQRDEAYSVLMRGLVQLPDYMERLQSGHKDIPIVLLPLLNDLRACRGEKLMTESALFAPDLMASLPSSADGCAEPLAPNELRAQALRLRLGFQAALLKWFRDEGGAGAAQHLRRLIDVLDRMRAISAGADARRLWWIAAGVVEAVENGGLEASVAVKLLLGRVDREIHRFATGGELEFAAEPPRELTKNLLYYVAHSGAAGSLPDGTRSAEIRRTYQLDTLLPTQSELQHAQGSMTGRNRNLLGTVSAAIKDDLLRVKEALDIFLRRGNADPAELGGQVELLDRVGDTLGMLGLGVPRRVVGEQRNVIEEMAQRKRSVDEGALLDVAGALLYVEASLDDHIERLGANSESDVNGRGLELPQAEVRRILDTLMHEALVNIDQAKRDIIAFIESPWEHAQVERIPRLLEEIAGALRMLGLPDPAELMTAIVRFVEVELIAHRRVPTAEQMDKLADALAAIEYYLEAARDQRRNRDKILDVARESLAALGYWPLPAPEAHAVTIDAATDAADARSGSAGASAETEFPADSAQDAPEALSWNAADAESTTQAQHDASRAAGVFGAFDEELPSIDMLPGRDLRDLVVGEAHDHAPPVHDLAGLHFAQTGAPEDAAGFAEIESGEEVDKDGDAEDQHPAAALAGFEHVPGGDIDDDIREVFVEEVEEEIANIRQQLPIWRSDIGNLDELKRLRRSFHTLKGSGRLVGALSLGEFSWKIENLMNRVLDHSVAPSAMVATLVDHAVDTLPLQLAALRGDANARANLADIMETADRLAAGEEAVLPPRAGATHTVRRKGRRRVPMAQQDLPDVGADIRSTDNLVGEASFDDPPNEIVAGPLPNIDPVLFDILQSEVAAHLGVIEDYLAACVPHAVPASEPLLRAAHTLHGAIAMVDIPTIGDALAPMESYVKRLHGASAVPTADGLSALHDTVALTREVMQRLEARNSDLPDSSALVARMCALRDALPDALHWYGEPDESASATRVEASTTDAEPAPPSAPTAPAASNDVDHTGSWLEGAGAAIPGHMLSSDTPMPAELQASLESLAAFDVLAPATPAAHGDATAIDDITADVDFGSVASFIEPPALDASVSDALDHVAGVRAGQMGETQPAQTGFDVDAPTQAPDAMSSADDLAAREDTPSESAGTSAADEDHTPATFDVATSRSSSTDHSVSEDTRPEPADAPAADEDDTHSAVDTATIPPARPSTPPDTRQPATEIDDAVDAASAARVAQSEPVSPSPRVMLTGEQAPPLADDPQPDGPLELPDIDDDLLDVFVQEGRDILDHADSLVAGLRDNPADHSSIGDLQRDLHTLKGGARMSALAPIGDLSHAMESLVDAVSDHRLAVDRTTVESLERGFDRLHALVQRVAHRQAVAMPVHAIARFESLVAGEGLLAAEPTLGDRADAAAHAASAGDAHDEHGAGVPVTRPAPRHLTAMDQQDVAHAPQEMIRVRSDLLDSLVNYAGEVSIYRSRLEQQNATFRFNLIEFDQTVNRLREQLRKLEIETEAQIIARYQREQQDTGLGAFDPLELDRFSQLQQLSRALGESVSDLISIQNLLDDQTRQSETLLLQQSRVSSDLQEGLMRTRMVPFDSMVPNLRRTLRQTARELDKRAQLKVEGAHGEMDRNLLERMKAPFEHMLRNSLAHGIEKPEERVAAGKPAEGTVSIAVSREATEVVLRVADDGRGMDRDAIRRQAIERGLLKPDAQLSDRDLYGFVLESGFSTAEQLTQLSGRGVGMDVVNNEIKQLGGSLAIESTPGAGVNFTIRLPFTLAVTQAILVKLGESVYAIPMSSVQGVARIERDDLERRVAAGEPKHAYAGEEFSIHDLAQLLGVPRARALDDAQVPLLMTRSGDQRAAIRIDAVVGSREIVVKSVGPQVSSVPGIFGATIMGDGSVVIILDLAPLVRRLAALRARIEAGAVEAPAYLAGTPERVAETRQKPLVMVVDDSITMRKVTTRVLERADFDVVTAKDGLDALEKLQETVPDLMLLDIEMPRMDGYELATYMRNDPRMRQVPIIMITSRTGEKHRQRALEIGVERYLGKPYQEDDLLRNVHEILRSDRG